MSDARYVSDRANTRSRSLLSSAVPRALERNRIIGVTFMRAKKFGRDGDLANVFFPPVENLAVPRYHVSYVVPSNVLPEHKHGKVEKLQVERKSCSK